MSFPKKALPASWSQFKHFGSIARKNLSVPHCQPDQTEEFPDSKVHLQPATWLKYWEVSQQTWYVKTLLASLGVVIGQNSPLRWGKKGKGFWQITHSSYSRHQIPSDTLNYLFPSNNFLLRTWFLPASKKTYNLRKLGAIGCPSCL